MSVVTATGPRARSFSLADGLCLAAAPIFALMALLTSVLGNDPADMICMAAAHGGSPFGSMVSMYWLMSAFHAAPWLRLIARRRSRSGPAPACRSS
ncbi:hypothetical protein [Hypericibacter adhaerens]|jgi:hypothetical protein|uniref:hypothetical protein n=1 Tax=Hypericibacter adhaerens TaxID=2602016 RepID=UPI0012451DC5|nr:hypothetical protein [Hypericibacter adhaerens]